MDLNQLLSGCSGVRRIRWIREIEDLATKLTLKIGLHQVLKNRQQCVTVEVCKLVPTCVCFMQMSTQKSRQVRLSTHDASMAQHLLDLCVCPHVTKLSVSKEFGEPEMHWPGN